MSQKSENVCVFQELWVRTAPSLRDEMKILLRQSETESLDHSEPFAAIKILWWGLSPAERDFVLSWIEQSD